MAILHYQFKIDLMFIGPIQVLLTPVHASFL
jgi:hypothetical protein